MIKLKNILNEADDQWRVKDIIAMQKAHERVLRAINTLDKAVKNIDKLADKNADKPNGKMFKNETNQMKRAYERDIYSPRSQFWIAYEEYRKGGRAAFPNEWDQ